MLMYYNMIFMSRVCAYEESVRKKGVATVSRSLSLVLYQLNVNENLSFLTGFLF